MKIQEHWLHGPGIVRQQTNKHSGPVDGPQLIVLHYTAGANALSSVEHLTHPQVQASAHLVIGREGTVWQLLPFHLAAWHAGLSHYQGRRGVNRFSIGIELEGTDFVAFEEAQYQALVKLLGAIDARYGLSYIVGHSDIAPGRKTDPGPHFDWVRLHSARSAFGSPQFAGAAARLQLSILEQSFVRA